jgi:hypothetical protein
VNEELSSRVQAEPSVDYDVPVLRISSARRVARGGRCPCFYSLQTNPTKTLAEGESRRYISKVVNDTTRVAQCSLVTQTASALSEEG